MIAVENWAESATIVTPHTAASPSVTRGGPPNVSPVTAAQVPEIAIALIVSVVRPQRSETTPPSQQPSAPTAITELSPPAYVGTALTTQTCMGFALTMASIWLTPPLVRWAGWPWAFAALAIGPALGVVAMGRLRMLPDSAKLAGGRR